MRRGYYIPVHINEFIQMTLKKIVQAVLFGLLSAGLILYITPLVKHRLSLFKETEIFSYYDAVKIASPAVVNVYNRSFESSRDTLSGQFLVNNLGSGVIMTSNGYILTNKHVIQNADQIIVALQSGNFYSAVLIGSDSLTDLAVLKIDADKLPTIPQNEKRPAKIGDVVLAIGNPLNLGQSITQGIISAIGRNALSEAGRQNFIQTDASINKGNSGGALINSAGELIGINTLRLGKDGDELAEGLNFSIPIGIANQVMHKIIKDGRVIRGYIGVSSSLFHPAAEKGVAISSVVQGGPAEKAGLRTGDIIMQVDDRTVENPKQMMDMIADMAPGSEIGISVLRQGVLLGFKVVIDEFPETLN